MLFGLDTAIHCSLQTHKCIDIMHMGGASAFCVGVFWDCLRALCMLCVCRTFLCMCICLFLFMCGGVCVCVYMLCVYICVYVCIHMCVCVCMFVVCMVDGGCKYVRIYMPVYALHVRINLDEDSVGKMVSTGT